MKEGRREPIYYQAQEEGKNQILRAPFNDEKRSSIPRKVVEGKEWQKNED